MCYNAVCYMVNIHVDLVINKLNKKSKSTIYIPTEVFYGNSNLSSTGIYF